MTCRIEGASSPGSGDMLYMSVLLRIMGYVLYVLDAFAMAWIVKVNRRDVPHKQEHGTDSAAI
jgi:hypothetical protein